MSFAFGKRFSFVTPIESFMRADQAIGGQRLGDLLERAGHQRFL
jgi:hypothetical protein